MRVEKKKTRGSSWFQGKVNFFLNLIFNHFITVFDIVLNGIYHINLAKYEDMEYFFLKFRRKCNKITIKMELAK